MRPGGKAGAWAAGRDGRRGATAAPVRTKGRGPHPCWGAGGRKSGALEQTFLRSSEQEAAIGTSPTWGTRALEHVIRAVSWCLSERRSQEGGGRRWGSGLETTCSVRSQTLRAGASFGLAWAQLRLAR